ncbi:MAG TPA: hypothetical protein VFZ18_05000 [Longimicrobiaceae bacterium]|jgi:hypothetical protein
MLFAWSGLVIAGLVMLATRAAANGYLVVMYWSRHGLYLLERGADERYHVFALYRLPVVLLRYFALNVAYSLLLLHRRARLWTHPSKPVAATAKI